MRWEASHVNLFIPDIEVKSLVNQHRPRKCARFIILYNVVFVINYTNFTLFWLQEVSIFVFEKKLADKLHKPRRKETVTEILKKSVHYLEMLRQPKLILKVVHSVEDCNETLAFAAEPVIASLANILAYQASVGGRTVNGPPSTGASIITTTAMPRPAHAREYNFLDFEIKYGIRQVSRVFTSQTTVVKL